MSLKQVSWLEGIIIPIYKNKGDPKNLSNYRPITILSCHGKLCTSVLSDRLTLYLNENNILNENQAGFRKDHLWSDHIFTLHSLFEILRKRKKKLFLAFIYFSQAFDNVWRAGLWYKLLQNNADGKFFKVIKNMYNNVKSCIKLDGSYSPNFEAEMGVRQGEKPVAYPFFPLSQ